MGCLHNNDIRLLRYENYIHVYRNISFSFLSLRFMTDAVHKNVVDWFIANKVREMRKERGITQEQIADHLDITPAYVGHIENAASRAKYKTLHLNELAKLFKCSPREFWPEQPL